MMLSSQSNIHKEYLDASKGLASYFNYYDDFCKSRQRLLLRLLENQSDATVVQLYPQIV